MDLIKTQLIESVFAGGGEIGARMRALDWSATVLGPVAQWPQSLGACVRVMLGSGYPMLVCWGPAYTMLYNDPYRPLIGKKHPAALVAATHRDLRTAIAEGRFREDLYHRLNVFPIETPPLRERKDDILTLVEYFVQRYAKKAGKSIRTIEKRTLERLQAYDWPGNIRELRNVIERSIILRRGSRGLQIASLIGDRKRA